MDGKMEHEMAGGMRYRSEGRTINTEYPCSSSRSLLHQSSAAICRLVAKDALLEQKLPRAFFCSAVAVSPT